MSKPIVTVKNHSSHNVYIEGDPNWDDQKLLLNDKPMHGGHTLAPNHSVQLSVMGAGAGNADMMGVIFADGRDYDSGGAGFYQMTIGQLKESGLLDVTDGDGQAKVSYTVSDQTAWSMTLDFTNS